MSNEMVVYSQQLQQYEGHFAKVLPAHMESSKLIRMAESAARLQPKLLECNRTSLLQSIMTGAILGLEIDGVTGQAFLVPFKGRVQLIIGYKGYVTLAFNSGYILEGRAVRQNDDFKFEYGLAPMLSHRYPSPTATAAQRGDVVAAYAVARHRDRPLSAFRVVPIDEILAARDKSSGYQYAKNKGGDTPWVTNFEAMCIKTAVRALADQLPLNVQRAVALEQKHEESGKPSYIRPENQEVFTDEEAEFSEVPQDKPVAY